LRHQATSRYMYMRQRAVRGHSRRESKASTFNPPPRTTSHPFYPPDLRAPYSRRPNYDCLEYLVSPVLLFSRHQALAAIHPSQASEGMTRKHRIRNNYII
jgi:hypothetical protein